MLEECGLLDVGGPENCFVFSEIKLFKIMMVVDLSLHRLFIRFYFSENVSTV